MINSFQSQMNQRSPLPVRPFSSSPSKIVFINLAPTDPPPNSSTPMVEHTSSSQNEGPRGLSLHGHSPSNSGLLTGRKVVRLSAAETGRRTTIIREMDAGSADVRVLPPLYDESWTSPTSEGR